MSAQAQSVVAALRSRERDIREHGVTRLSLIGSIARGEAGADSDVDVLVDIDPGRAFSLVDHSGLRLYICDLLRRETDVVVRDALRPAVAERVRLEEVVVF